MLPRAAEPVATTRPTDPAPLLEELATLRQENAALRRENAVLRAESAVLQAESAVLQERVREVSAAVAQGIAVHWRGMDEVLPDQQIAVIAASAPHNSTSPSTAWARSSTSAASPTPPCCGLCASSPVR